MGSVYLLFDYFKEAFRLNRDNKVLYRPQIVFIVLRSLLILGVGVWLYSWVGLNGVESIQNKFSDASFSTFIKYFTLGAVIFLLAGIIGVLIESGLYNMYKRVILDGQANMDDFWQGVSKYLFKFILGNIVVMFIWAVAFVAYLVAGIFTLGIAFMIPLTLVVSLFLTMWKVSLVMNDHGIIESLSDSFKFAKRHFWPLAVLQVAHWSFIGGVSGGGSGSSFNNLTKLSDRGTNTLDSTVPRVDYASIERFIKIAIGILIPVISVASAVAALIMMIFEVFFTITIFIAYKNNFKGFEQAAVEGVEL